MSTMMTATTAHATIPYPVEWTVDTTSGEDFAASIAGDDSYRPRVALSSEASSLSIEEASVAELRSLLAAVPGTHILGCDPWLEQDGLPARQYLYVRPETGSSVIVRGLLWKTDTHLVRLSLKSIAHQVTVTDPIFYSIALAIEVHG